MKSNHSQNTTGFTLIEVLISLFIFSIVMTAAMQIFASAYSGYRVTRLVERDIENAQFAMNALAKSLRTSSVVSGDGTVQALQFFDHSQNKCFRYRISGGALEMASGASAGVAACNTASLVSFTAVTTGMVTGSFRVITSTPIGGPPTRVGKVTIALAIAQDGATHNNARLQTSVSLRDFGNIGL